MMQRHGELAVRHVLLLVLLSLSTVTLAQNTASNPLKAMLNYNFAKYAQWPSSRTQMDVQLCHFNEAYKPDFERLIGKRIGDGVVSVKQLSAVNEADDCHLVYIDKSNRDLLQRMFLHLVDKPVLTVSDISGFVDAGGMIEIVMVDSKLRFKVNLVQLKKVGLGLSSQVLKLAVELKR
jgi:YfiR/HmsC-like